MSESLVRHQSLKGFRDILPGETRVWNWMEDILRDQTRVYGFEEIRLPVVETSGLFTRGIGQGTDIIGKEMYTFDDRSEPPVSLALRPELTAGAARAYIEHSVAQSENLTRWYYSGPAFRYEQPQAGRYRQFQTLGVELLGSEHPDADIEVITLARDILKALGLTNYRLLVNSIGTPEERLSYREDLMKFLLRKQAFLSEDSRARLGTNPLRILDSKDPGDIRALEDAPVLLEYLGEDSRMHFERVRYLLDLTGVVYQIEPRLVRGLDYYTRTVFEFVGSNEIGAQNTLIGGGRYDNLIQQLGGPVVPAVGFGIGLDRLVLSIQSEGLGPKETPGLDAYLVAQSPGGRDWITSMSPVLRGIGLSIGRDLLWRSTKAQMREANRLGARYTVIVGENELAGGFVQVKDMSGHDQIPVPFETLKEYLMLRRPRKK